MPGTNRGLEIGIHLKSELHDDDFVARAVGNLATYTVQKERGEQLEWQMLRVGGHDEHYFRLIVCHPKRVLDLGIKRDLARILKELSRESLDQPRQRFAKAESEGLRPVPLRHVKEVVDFWRDDFWDWIG